MMYLVKKQEFYGDTTKEDEEEEEVNFALRKNVTKFKEEKVVF